MKRRIKLKKRSVLATDSDRTPKNRMQIAAGLKRKKKKSKKQKDRLWCLHDLAGVRDE